MSKIYELLRQGVWKMGKGHGKNCRMFRLFELGQHLPVMELI